MIDSSAPEQTAIEAARLELRLLQLEAQEKARIDFLSFAKYVWPEAIFGAHHTKMADSFNRLADGTLKRLIVNMPPRHTKSEFSSYLLPAFIMGRKPKTKIIQATHTGELAVRFGRKVRNLMDSEEYKQVFSDVALRADSKAAGRWDTDHGGEYFAVGVGGAMTGRGADLLIIDDPHSEQDALSELAMENAWDWYTSGPRQRLQPGGAIVIVMCMTGDTDVLMADGTTTKLKDIRPGDKVATYEKGGITTSQVNNWKSNGIDSIYAVKTQSGIILRANARHPFLVDIGGKREWIRLQNLKPGMQLVATKAVKGPHDQKQDQDYVAPAKLKHPIIEKTQMRQAFPLGITGNGKARNANAENLLAQKGYAPPVMEKHTSPSPELQLKKEHPVLSIDMGLQVNSMIKWLKTEITNAMYAGSILLQKIQERIGMESSVLTTATTQVQLEGCFATTATLPLDMEKPLKNYKGPLSTYNVILDPIVEITAAGQEEVFDIEVDKTENFIANGVVSHNTRWNTKDLTARLIKAQTSHKADRWEVIEFPAVLPSGNPLWPSFWKIEELLAVKASLSPQKWQAQWQQQPTNDEGAILKRDWWQVWPSDEAPPVEYIIQSYDTAYSKKETADFSVITTWGVFYPNADSGPNIILLDVTRGRWDFPELKRIAKENYDQWQPDNVLIEAKATGITLQQELRRMGIPVTMYSPGGRRSGQDKVSRAHSIAPILESGMVWAPDTEWAEELVEECAAFPNGDNDDMVDSTTQALMRFRAGNFISLSTDDTDDEEKQDVAYEYY